MQRPQGASDHSTATPSRLRAGSFALCTDFLHSVHLSGLMYQAYAAVLHDTSRRLNRIQAKTLILRPELNSVVPRAATEVLQAGIPHSRVVTLEGATHSYAYDDPATTGRLILEWLQQARPFDAGRRSDARRLCEPYDRALSLPVGHVKALTNATRAVIGV